MKPRITLITLCVDDLEKSLQFYRDGLGLKTEGIIGTEFEHGAVAFLIYRLVSNSQSGRERALPMILVFHWENRVQLNSLLDTTSHPRPRLTRSWSKREEQGQLS